MPKKKPGMTPEQQSDKFRDAVRDLIKAGELNLTEADAEFERLLAKSAPPKRPK